MDRDDQTWRTEPAAPLAEHLASLLVDLHGWRQLGQPENAELKQAAA